MNRIRSYSVWLFGLLVVIGTPTQSFARLEKPVSGGDQKEILIISGKRRLYYNVSDQGLQYSVKGPTRVEIISRYTSTKKSRKSISFNFTAILDEVDTIHVHHRLKISHGVRSVQHENAYITYSGKDYLNLDEGRHHIQILPDKDQPRPSLVRVLTKEFNATYDEKKWLTPTTSPAAIPLTSQNATLNYYEASNKIPLSLVADGKRTLKIYSRLEFEEWMGNEEVYRLQVREGKKIIGTYFFSTERSDVASSEARPEIVPAKWRTCEIAVPDGKNSYEVVVLEKDRKVLLRFLEYK